MPADYPPDPRFRRLADASFGVMPPRRWQAVDYLYLHGHVANTGDPGVQRQQLARGLRMSLVRCYAHLAPLIECGLVIQTDWGDEARFTLNLDWRLSSEGYPEPPCA